MKLTVLFLPYFLNYLRLTESMAEYYWRDYDGTIPCDAIQGGTDHYGHYTYIGQIAVNDCISDKPNLISATIYSGDISGYATYQMNLIQSYKHVKILCSNKIHKFFWSTNFRPNCMLIKGSVTDCPDLDFIGRTQYEYQNVTGRFSTDIQTLYVPWSMAVPSQTVQFMKYDMLMYCDD